jgi:hypothetical protein
MKREQILINIRNSDCLDDRRDISPMSRWVVLSWIREVIVEHKLSRQAFHLTTQLLDVFLSTENISQDNFQLISVAALMVALKTCDVEQLATNYLVEFVYDDENMTPDQNIKAMDDAKRFLMKFECKLMKTMKWDVMIPTVIDFLEHAFQFATIASGNAISYPFPDIIRDYRDDPSANTIIHQKYDTVFFARAASIADKAVMDYHSMKYSPSEIAASIFWRVYSESSKEPISELLLMQATGYKLSALQSCIGFLNSYVECNVCQILQDPFMIEAYQKWLEADKEFRLEQDQMPFFMKSFEFGNKYLT